MVRPFQSQVNSLSKVLSPVTCWCNIQSFLSQNTVFNLLIYQITLGIVIVDPSKAIQSGRRSQTLCEKEAKNKMHLIGEGERRKNRKAKWVAITVHAVRE